MGVKESDTRPACRYAALLSSSNRWVEKPLTDRLRAWYDPCSACFPDGEIDVEQVVLRAYRKSTPQSLHEPDEQ